MNALTLPAPSAGMTIAEIFDWPGDGTGTSHELVDGELCAMAPTSTTHGTIQARRARLGRDGILAVRAIDGRFAVRDIYDKTGLIEAQTATEPEATESPDDASS